MSAFDNLKIQHTCHNPNCGKPLDPKYVCHSRAWYQIPYAIRQTIWRHYRPGQEVDKQATPEYHDALEAAIDYMRKNHVMCDRVMQ